jgi:G3E family GTPase
LWEGTLLDIDTPQNISIHRTKGRIITQEGDEWILQGVREIYEIKSTGKTQEQDSKIVLIGEGLQKNDIKSSLQRYLGV